MNRAAKDIACRFVVAACRSMTSGDAPAEVPRASGGATARDQQVMSIEQCRLAGMWR
jgi:hypothetical protein